MFDGLWHFFGVSLEVLHVTFGGSCEGGNWVTLCEKVTLTLGVFEVWVLLLRRGFGWEGLQGEILDLGEFVPMFISAFVFVLVFAFSSDFFWVVF